MAKYNKNGVGILGGTFDPAHKGHVRISKIAIRKLRLKKIYLLNMKFIGKDNYSEYLISPFKKNILLLIMSTQHLHN